MSEESLKHEDMFTTCKDCGTEVERFTDCPKCLQNECPDCGSNKMNNCETCSTTSVKTKGNLIKVQRDVKGNFITIGREKLYFVDMVVLENNPLLTGVYLAETKAGEFYEVVMESDVEVIIREV